VKEWQFNVLFFVGVGGAILLLIGPELGFTFSDNPTALTGVGAILTYVLASQRGKSGDKPSKPSADDNKNSDPPEEEV
jgi:hypothetical protein